jgi:hypothetical protein
LENVNRISILIDDEFAKPNAYTDIQKFGSLKNDIQSANYPKIANLGLQADGSNTLSDNNINEKY